jgi:Tfp pilus assembly protein PilW
VKYTVNSRKWAFTLVEMLMSLSCGTIILAAVVAASVSLQRTFSLVESYSGTESDQVRVLDYIAMDSRRAFSATVANGQLQFTLPAYYNSSSNYQPYAPTIAGGAKIAYGPGQVVITYAQTGTNFTREVQVQDASSNVLSDNTTVIARNVATFTVTPVNQSNPWSTVSCSVMFFPTFTRMTGLGTWRSGPTAPNGSTAGSNGDWYVIDPTATNQTTVGNVYFMSGGSYSLIQNVKATTVYCNTFLRNANARQNG